MTNSETDLVALLSHLRLEECYRIVHLLLLLGLGPTKLLAHDVHNPAIVNIFMQEKYPTGNTVMAQTRLVSPVGTRCSESYSKLMRLMTYEL